MAKTKVYTMTKEIKCVTDLQEWQALSAHQQAIAKQHMRDWFQTDQSRFSRYSLQFGDILLDYSRNRINDETIQLLCDLANACQLPDKITALCKGYPVNVTEKRPALHTALRDQRHTPLLVDGNNIAQLIADAFTQMTDFTRQIHSGTWKGATGKPIRHIVNLGVGGSYLGTMMCHHALKDFAVSPLQCHFISSIDKALMSDVLQQIDLEATLFIVSSKTFSTLETMTNAATLLSLVQNMLGKEAIKHHFIGITADQDKALRFGLPKENIFPLWDFVGGRYSIWFTIGLPLMLMIGSKQFREFLDGAFEIDQHFQQAEFSQNIPVLLALLSIWYTNFFHATAQAVVPYAHRLRHLTPYLQQADMESNGKRVRLNGNTIPYATGPVIFGEEGCNGQHSYHQLLHQGQHLIPVDFIVIGKAATNAHDHHQDMLVASALSQAQALMLGKTMAEAETALLHQHYAPADAAYLAKHQVNPGNRPSNVLFFDELTPKNLGALLAIYEHKIFVQSTIWDINPFDQWGVELGKQLLPDILHCVQGQPQHTPTDSATAGLIAHFKKIQGHV